MEDVGVMCSRLGSRSSSVVPLCRFADAAGFDRRRLEHRRTAEQRERRYAATFSRICPYGLAPYAAMAQSRGDRPRPFTGTLGVPQCTHGPRRVRVSQGLRRTREARRRGRARAPGPPIFPTARLSMQRSDEQVPRPCGGTLRTARSFVDVASRGRRPDRTATTSSETTSPMSSVTPHDGRGADPGPCRRPWSRNAGTSATSRTTCRANRR